MNLSFIKFLKVFFIMPILMKIFLIFVAEIVPYNKLNLVFMEVKLSFWDLVTIARQFNFNLDALAIDEDGSLKLLDGSLVGHNNLQYSDTWRVSDEEYKKISALVSILNEILKFRPLPF